MNGYNDEYMKRLTLDDIKKGENECGDCGNSPNVKPKWLDILKFHRGQKFYKDNMMSIMNAMHFSIVPGFAIVNLLDPLVFTNNSDAPEKSLKRYAQTFFHVNNWCTDPDIWSGEDNPAYRSTQIVRKMHRSVAAAIDKKKCGDKVYLNQYDMALVQFGFVGATITYPEHFGISCSVSELEDYIHLWRGIGYLLGIDDKYNICCGNYQDTYDLSKEVEQKILLPAIKDPPKDFQKMVNAYVNGVNLEAGYTAFTATSMIALTYDATGEQLQESLSVTDTIRFYWFKILMFAIRCVPGVRYFFNRRTTGFIDELMTKLFGKGADFYKNFYDFKAV